MKFTQVLLTLFCLTFLFSACTKEEGLVQLNKKFKLNYNQSSTLEDADLTLIFSGVSDMSDFVCCCIPCPRGKGVSVKAITPDSTYLLYFYKAQPFELSEDKLTELLPREGLIIELLDLNFRKKEEKSSIRLSVKEQ